MANIEKVGDAHLADLMAGTKFPSALTLRMTYSLEKAKTAFLSARSRFSMRKSGDS
jgi:hypothetical protein